MKKGILNKFLKTLAVVSIFVLVVATLGVINDKSRCNHILIFLEEQIEIHQKKKLMLENCTSEEERNAALWLLENMKGQYSYNGSVSQSFFRYIKKNPEVGLKRLWLDFNSKNVEVPQLEQDIKSIDADALVEDRKKAFVVWKSVPWCNEIDFNLFCRYILPYKVCQEPFANWRTYYWNKYSFLLEGIINQRKAFQKIYEFERNNFPVKNTYFPYEQDPILLDNLHGGNCRQRAFHMVYVMRALGLPVAVDYTPVWANYGENGHYWVILIENDDKVFMLHKHIDGAYERNNTNSAYNGFTSSIDSLKKISKIYRLAFWNVNNIKKQDEQMPYKYLNSNYTYDVTKQYDSVTTKNVVEVSSSFFSDLYVCTYSQEVGWIPIGKAIRMTKKKIDVGPLLDDNVVLVAEYKDGCFTPISSPFWIRHGHHNPYKIEPNFSRECEVTLYRKYLLRTTWLNRWSEIVGTKIETSDNENFNVGTHTIFSINELPHSETIIIPIERKIKDYIRILPKEEKYPVVAEVQLLDKNNQEINHKKYQIYSIGNTLTGDTIVTKKLQDGKLSTTFYKRFPFWIGFKVDRVKEKLKNLRIVMWNDENQIQKNHDYELFYFYNCKWCSIGRKKASSNCIRFTKVPSNALLLLRDYSSGKEERIFMYKNNRQIWF